MKGKVILVSSNQLGNGDKTLGENVLETFFTIVKQKEELPVAVFCMNSGVLTMTENSLVSVHLKEMEEKGVEILACKTCADHYKVSNKLAVGKISGMAEFVDLAAKYEVLTIS
ncbi:MULTISPECIES: DsrE family protein [Neobacillus]|jgi:predicted peroxiredoxin|uniref:DsrE family protein n=1 Tax=Neobacillus sedimentimangrovi TaxID=2699460 RepID=A0ABS8QEV5_9BACI|nr:DsrE family protein [Neobacillus sedimentimangrovi]AIM17407.1 transcriptional regulator [Bacillus sp. X1(2014)]MCD4837773.1 DsrE family protein [Neobacillus sedimentimangrovi]